MAKKRRVNSDAIRKRREQSSNKSKAINPFEYKVTKAKRETLNTKLQKSQISRPGQSRVRHRQIQDETLMVEYRNKNRKNVFIDNRIDKKSATREDLEKAAVEKFAIAARRKASAKRAFDSGIGEVGDYSDDEEILTHRGQSLATMERFDDPDLSEDENDPNPGHLTQEATEALFGGGKNKEEKRDHKEIMLDVIAKSKKFKYERQQEKEKMINDFEQFDEEFKMIRKLTAGFDRTADQKYDDRRALGKDDFSRLMREMKFDARVQPGQKLKTAEQMATEAREKREREIREMKDRMKPAESDDENDDNVESVEKISQPKTETKEAAPLAYDMDSGVLLNNKDELSAALRNIRRTDSDEEEDSEEDESGDEDDEENDGQILDIEPTFGSDSEEGEEGEDEPEKVKSALMIEDEEEEDEETPAAKKPRLEPLLTEVSAKGDIMLSSVSAFRLALLKREAAERVGVVVSLFKKVASGNDSDRQSKLRALFQFSLVSMMRGDLAAQDGLCSCLFQIAEKCPSAHQTVQVLLSEFTSESVVSLEFVRFLRVVVTLYSVSDYRNVIGLPAQVAAVKMLARIRSRELGNVALGLYTASMLLESVRLNGRFIPEVFVYLKSVMSLGIEPDERPRGIFPSFRLTRTKVDTDPESFKQLDLTLTPSGNDLIHAAAGLLKAAAKKGLASGAALFGSFIPIVNELKLDSKLKEETLEALNKVVAEPMTTLSRKKKVKMIQLYEPKIEAPGSRAESRKTRELKNLKQKVKAEKAGARKKIKLDSARLQEEKQKTQARKDTKRKETTKRILGQLADQEGSVKKTQKAKYNLFPDL